MSIISKGMNDTIKAMTDGAVDVLELQSQVAETEDVLKASLDKSNELQAQVDELEADGGAAAWILEWMVAEQYRKPDIPAIVRKAHKHYKDTLVQVAQLQAQVDAKQLALDELRQNADSLLERAEKAEAQASELQSQVDELKACLKLCIEWADNWESPFMEDDEWTGQDYPRIKAAIKGDSDG